MKIGFGGSKGDKDVAETEKYSLILNVSLQ